MTGNSPARRQMHLGASIHAFGSHRASWRHPDVARGDMTDFDLHVRAARKCEEGLFDFLFMGDSIAAIWGEEPETLGREPPLRALDPWTLMAALAAVTERIGLIATLNTTYSMPPFTFARMLATLDFISGGRAGWNLVTGANAEEARNFGNNPHPPADERYARGAEYADVVFGLWDTWDDGAVICDRDSGYYFDPDKVRILDHHGPYFDVRGPLTAPRPPQGRPVTVQAGASDTGRNLAASVADVIFAIVTSVENAKAFYDDVKGRAAKLGRRPEDIAILPGVQVFVGATQAEADEKLRRMEECYDSVVAFHQINRLFDVDLRDYPLDGPFPDVPVNPARGSRPQTIVDLARRGNLTLGQTLQKLGSLGHWMLAGTPTSIADTLQEYFEEGGADGFNILPPYMMGSLDDFVDQVVPELQRRGLYRTRYEGSMLRDHLGLARPARG